AAAAASSWPCAGRPSTGRSRRRTRGGPPRTTRGAAGARRARRPGRGSTSRASRRLLDRLRPPPGGRRAARDDGPSRQRKRRRKYTQRLPRSPEGKPASTESLATVPPRGAAIEIPEYVTSWPPRLNRIGAPRAVPSDAVLG